MKYLEGLNERQKEAVLATDGPISVLAGAGSGKTTVLTTRMYHLIRQGVPAESILAVTFTNKAAREMRDRIAKRLETTGTLPFVATFHGLGRELLQEYGRSLDVPRFFSIYDRDDSEKTIKDALKALDVDPKEVPPRFILSRISKAKGDGITLQEFVEKFSRDSFRNRIVAKCWKRYDEALKKERALDFDDLIMLPVRLLETNADVRRIVQNRFSHIHVDEFQDTNELQAKLIQLIGGARQNIFVVGDIDQCLVKGTQITMADKSLKNIEDISIGNEVLSAYGSGALHGSPITSIKKKRANEVVKITTTTGKEIVSTPEHIHFAGYKLGLTPQLYFTYLMNKKGVGWRIGVSQTYTHGVQKPMLGFIQRCNQEHADSLWIVGVFKTQIEARVHEYKLSLTYSIPTIPFVARKGGSTNGYVHEQETINAIFTSFDTNSSAKRLLKDLRLSEAYPHHRAQATRSDRRNICITLCGDWRGKSSLHKISMMGNDEEGKLLLKHSGFSVRAAKAGSSLWRFETSFASLEKLYEVVRTLQEIFPTAVLVEQARLGGNKKNPKDHNSLPFLPAASILPGMALFNEETNFEIVASVEKMQDDVFVFDIDVEGTHNFIANGIITHNCIYTWRGATIDNLLSFDETYPNAKTIVLEHNYRSTKNIVDAANGIIEVNKNRKEKRSVTDNPEGERIVVHPENTAELEARYIARMSKHLIQTGNVPEEIAVLFRTNFQSRVLEEAFLQNGVPYRLLGTRFFERKEVKDVLSWVRLALDPSRENDRVRAAQNPSRGIGKVTLGKMIAGKPEDFKPSERSKVAAFEETVQELARLVETEMPSQFLRAVIEKSGIQTLLSKGTEDDQERLENVRELATLATRYDHLSGKEGVSLFLTDAALASDQDELDRKDYKKGVTLMTVHAAKGLEFENVFVSGLEEGLFPHQGMGNEKRDEEEERRLFYVAVTRAKKRLYLTFARIRRIYGTDFLSEPSGFLRDINPMLTEYTDPSEFDSSSEVEYEEIIEA